jgi:hypothetical protein
MVNDHHLRIGKAKVDPLTESPEAGRVLFERLTAMCKDFPLDAVINAATNLLLNVLRQRNEARDQAERDFDEMFGKVKAVLMQHYDGPTGKRRSIFPFHQTIHAPFVSLKPKDK